MRSTIPTSTRSEEKQLTFRSQAPISIATLPRPRCKVINGSIGFRFSPLLALLALTTLCSCGPKARKNIVSGVEDGKAPKLSPRVTDAIGDQLGSPSELSEGSHSGEDNPEESKKS